jgi:hypothetical protein
MGVSAPAFDGSINRSNAAMSRANNNVDGAGEGCKAGVVFAHILRSGAGIAGETVADLAGAIAAPALDLAAFR